MSILTRLLQFAPSRSKHQALALVARSHLQPSLHLMQLARTLRRARPRSEMTPSRVRGCVDEALDFVHAKAQALRIHRLLLRRTS
eukprot:1533379-Rhodomonas_salina.2